MSFLSRFFRSDQKLTQPNFKASKKEYFNFSGNLIEVMDPPQTAMIPLKRSKTKMDLFNLGADSLQDWGNYVELYYKRGWDFWGKGSHPKGGIICDVIISYFPENLEPKFNQFYVDNQKKSLLVHWFVSWGWEDEGSEFGVKGKIKDFDYPIAKDDISTIKKKDVVWLRSTASYKNKSPTIKYSIPLTARHNLIITFETHAYRDVDFHSPATNLKETAMAVIDDFMDNIKVTYSEQSLKDMQAVKNATQ